MEATLTLDRSDRLSRSKAMARKKKNRKRQARTARESRKTTVEQVEGGYGRGFDTVERVDNTRDTVRAMFRRRQLTERQFNTADHYRRAFEYSAAVPSVMDDSKVGGSAPGSRSPTAQQLWASNILNDAAKILGQIDGAVLRMIAGEGFSIEQAAHKLANSASRRLGSLDAECKMVGKRFRQGLDRMAQEWLGPERSTKSHIQSFASEGAKPTVIGATFEPDPRGHAHAYKDHKTGQTIYVSKDGKAVAVPKKG